MKNKAVVKPIGLILSLLTFMCYWGNLVFALEPKEKCPQLNCGKRHRYLTTHREQDVLAVDLGKYIVDYKATYSEVAAEFNISKTKVWDYIKKLDQLDNLLYKRVKEVVKQNRVIAMGRIDLKKRALAVSLGNYMIEFKATYNEVAIEFNISKSMVCYCIKNLKKINFSLYKRVLKVLEHNKNHERCFIEINQNKRRKYLTDPEKQGALAVNLGNYMVECKATYNEAALEFNVSKATVGDYIKKLKEIDGFLYKKVKEIVKQHKHHSSCFVELG